MSSAFNTMQSQLESNLLLLLKQYATTEGLWFFPLNIIDMFSSTQAHTLKDPCSQSILELLALTRMEKKLLHVTTKTVYPQRGKQILPNIISIL